MISTQTLWGLDLPDSCLLWTRATFANPAPLNGLVALRIVNSGIQDGAAGALWRRRLPTDASDEEE
jgi:hypothetical protein